MMTSLLHLRPLEQRSAQTEVARVETRIRLSMATVLLLLLLPLLS